MENGQIFDTKEGKSWTIFDSTTYIYTHVYIHLYTSEYIYVHLSIYLSIYLSIHLPMYLSIYQSIYLLVSPVSRKLAWKTLGSKNVKLERHADNFGREFRAWLFLWGGGRLWTRENWTICPFGVFSCFIATFGPIEGQSLWRGSCGLGAFSLVLKAFSWFRGLGTPNPPFVLFGPKIRERKFSPKLFWPKFLKTP